MQLDVRFVPKADITSLFDHLVRSKQQQLRNRVSDCFRSLVVNEELKFGRLLDGKISRLLALENFCRHRLRRGEKFCADLFHKT